MIPMGSGPFGTIFSRFSFWGSGFIFRVFDLLLGVFCNYGVETRL